MPLSKGPGCLGTGEAEVREELSWGEGTEDHPRDPRSRMRGYDRVVPDECSVASLLRSGEAEALRSGGRCIEDEGEVAESCGVQGGTLNNWWVMGTGTVYVMSHSLTLLICY